MRKKTKHSIVFVSHNSKRQKTLIEEEEDAKDGNDVFRVRRLDFSLESWEIRSSEFVGTRSKAALRGEDKAWIPDLRIFDKLREVGVSPYLDFTLCLSVFTMFELNEAVRGRLISSKAWNRGGKL